MCVQNAKTLEFIEKARLVHGNKYDYSEVEYITNKTKVKIICPIHGPFWQAPVKHLAGQGCPDCANEAKKVNQLITFEEFEKRAREVHNGRYTYIPCEMHGIREKVGIICPEHGFFEQRANDHLNGHGCPKCARERTNEAVRRPRGPQGPRDFDVEEETKSWLDKFRSVHGDKYEYPDLVYTGHNTDKCNILCPEHGIFQQSFAAHYAGQGCPECGKKKIGDARRWTQDEFIAKANEVHNHKYDYSLVDYQGMENPVKIICPDHGVFEQTAANHISGKGCPKCVGFGLSTEEFVAKLRNVHGDRYDYSLVEYRGSNGYITPICPEHGMFRQRASHHLDGSNCPACAREDAANKHRTTKEEYIRRANAVHHNKYDYTEVEFKSITDKVKIKCPDHGFFLQGAYDHLKGYGCPACGASSSRGERAIQEYVSCLVGEENVISNTRSVIKRRELDIYIPSKQLAIEYNGLYWHSEEKGKDRMYHLDKLNACNEKGIHLIQIFEDEWLHNSEIVKSKIRHILGLDQDMESVYARKCIVSPISKADAEEFLNKNHIQGYAPAKIYLGARYNDRLVGVMTFKYEEGKDEWELARFATDNTVRCIGLGGKMFMHFVREYKPNLVKSFADLRWTIDKENNLYTKLGFTLEKQIEPSYTYIFPDDVTRRHKFNFRKQILHEKYGFPLSMTELEMCTEIGATRVWDCGLLKYVWKPIVTNSSVTD